MIATFLLLVVPGAVPAGAYSMPDLCRELTKASGAYHYAAVGLQSYPVFVSVKSGDPARVRLLVASAMGGEWKKSDSGYYTLVAKKPAPDEDFAEFSRLFAKACAKWGAPHGASVKDLYKMACGRSIRYGDPPNAYVLPWSDEIKGTAGDSADEEKRVVAHRIAAGFFGFNGHGLGGDFEFSGLSQKVEDLLGEDLRKPCVTAEMYAKEAALLSDSAAMKAAFGNPAKKDPIVAMTELSLPGVGEAVKADLVMALPDATFWALKQVPAAGATVRECLEPYAAAGDWDVVSGAVVLRLPCCERLVSTQTERQVLAKFLVSIEAKGVCDAGGLSTYVAAQNPSASDCCLDVIFLLMAGVVVDFDFRRDYPYAIRLYANLTSSDWARLRSGAPFLAAELSPAVRRLLIEMLLDSNGALRQETAEDPAWWPSLDMRDLVVNASVVEEDVVVAWLGASDPNRAVTTATVAAGDFESLRERLGKEPLYQAAHRRKLRLTIASRDGKHSVETSFSALRLDEAHKPGPWQKLPPAMAKEFDEELKALERLRSQPPDVKPIP